MKSLRNFCTTPSIFEPHPSILATPFTFEPHPSILRHILKCLSHAQATPNPLTELFRLVHGLPSDEGPFLGIVAADVVQDDFDLLLQLPHYKTAQHTHTLQQQKKTSYRISSKGASLV